MRSRIEAHVQARAPALTSASLSLSRTAQRKEGSPRRQSSMATQGLGAQLSEAISAQVYKAPIEGARAAEVAES